MADRPFWKADPSVWEVVIAPYLESADPWPRDVVVEDLRWLADQAACACVGWSKGSMSTPGRPALVKRWGWTSHRVRLLLIEVNPDAIIDRRVSEILASPAGRQLVDRRSPARRQPVASVSVNNEGSPVPNRQPVASPSPARRQPVASETTHARGTENREQRSEIREDLSPTAPAADAPDVAPALPLPGGVLQSAGAREGAPADPPGKPAPPRWRQDWDVAADRWAAVAYQSHVEGHNHPIPRKHRRPDSPDRGQGRDLKHVLSARGLEVTLQIVDWLQYAPAAAYLRDSPQPRGLDTIRRHSEKYALAAEEWIIQGRTGSPEAKPVRRGPTARDLTHWDWRDEL